MVSERFRIALMFICLSAVIGVSPAFAVNMQEGQWEHTMEIKMEGLPVEKPSMPFTTTQCLTQKDMVPKTSKKEQNCEVKDQKITGDKVSWKVKCVEKEAVTESEGEITYSGSAYTGTMKTKTIDKSGRAMNSTTKMKGRRVGDCPK